MIAKCIWCKHSMGSLHETEVNCVNLTLLDMISKVANRPIYIVMREEAPDYFHNCPFYKEDSHKRKKE